MFAPVPQPPLGRRPWATFVRKSTTTRPGSATLGDFRPEIDHNPPWVGDPGRLSSGNRPQSPASSAHADFGLRHARGLFARHGRGIGTSGERTGRRLAADVRGRVSLGALRTGEAPASRRPAAGGGGVRRGAGPRADPTAVPRRVAWAGPGGGWRGRREVRPRDARGDRVAARRLPGGGTVPRVFPPARSTARPLDRPPARPAGAGRDRGGGDGFASGRADEGDDTGAGELAGGCGAPRRSPRATRGERDRGRAPPPVSPNPHYTPCRAWSPSGRLR
jgi:hypothetical protein